jgi:serine/threonine-protein phosphatase 5
METEKARCIIREKKDRGNEYFKTGNYTQALENYNEGYMIGSSLLSGSIDSESTEIKHELALILHNIAVVQFKLMNYLESVSYVEELARFKVVEKLTTRRCMAYFKLGEHKKALDIYKKLRGKEACPGLSKAVKQLKSEIIESFHTVLRVSPNSELYSYVEDEGLRVDRRFLRDMVLFLTEGNILEARYVVSILRDGYSCHSNLDNIIFVDYTKQENIIVFGDTHGQFLDTLHAFSGINGHMFSRDKEWMFDASKKYIFNGDFVDRGPSSVENFIFLIALKLLYPQNIFLNRGNHEFHEMNLSMGFYDELRKKYPLSYDNLFSCFLEVFSVLPLATVISRNVLVVHGGLPERTLDLQSILDLDRRTVTSINLGKIYEGLMWSDPGEIEGALPSKRGVGIVFGKGITRKFLLENKLSLIVRSHEYTNGGVKTNHDGRVVTVFSAPNYCNEVSKGAFLVLKKPGDGRGNRDEYVVEHFG